MKVVVVGAGVIGLTTALTLKRKLDCDVVVVAKEIPGDADPLYTSTKAGAQWACYAGNKRAEFSYRIFDELSRVPEAWVTRVPVYVGQIDPKGPATEPDLRSFVDNYEWIGEDQRKFPGVGHIYRFDTFTISPAQYLAYLANELLKLGVAIQRRVVRSFEDVAADYRPHAADREHAAVPGHVQGEQSRRGGRVPHAVPAKGGLRRVGRHLRRALAGVRHVCPRRLRRAAPDQGRQAPARAAGRDPHPQAQHRVPAAQGRRRADRSRPAEPKARAQLRLQQSGLHRELGLCTGSSRPH
ncbi:hypothetical protein KL930_003669 [Ogataea haglerorum]|uniref:FAD dependent oxidoreductase domain-containing protein n=1 Tax=Ogataea haglerorum TaxID=1937702 RepID=A0ABQ7RES7_9ASCO|nr:hypothetical protein KL915_003062 [Ogataea haglerorum]KAG7705575.1 hypothetical protein KL914_003413 [Ogataea haglerorum]KAG7707408.1 hypothetical protein KL950_003068 [Ogataea haglerorum]KAG7731245.1 hypothetical protein KL948_003525 [Ogataea haglerorum]KAG7743426.1 hypothetical protein KL932_002167 [Ogataea haglerorum]